MLSCLFAGGHKPTKMDAIQLYRSTFDKVLVTEVEMSWSEVAASVLFMLGEADA